MSKASRVSASRLLFFTVFMFISLALIIPLFGGRVQTSNRAGGESLPSAIRFDESFDGVTAPALPPGWTTSRTGSNALFTTSPLDPDTPPHALFTNNPATAGSAEITSPAFTLGNARTRITIRHRYQTEFRRGYDGGVLEMSVNGGAFQDILAAGGVFIAGGYIEPIQSHVTGNPLLGRMTWTGDSEGYQTTIVELPLGLANQTVRLRWRYGTDNSYEGPGWRIDRVQVADLVPMVVRYQENFDGVGAPNLPPQWTTEETHFVRAFKTHMETAHTAPNSVFAPVTIPGGSSAIISPNIEIGANSPKLIFQHHYAVENGDEGGVLEISINGGPFVDILDAGGSFVHGGYTDVLNDGAGNPLENRSAWTGSTLGFIITEINLPPSTYRQHVRFKWLFGTDNFIPSIGWWIDNVQVVDALSGENLNGITIPAAGLASPYPSEIAVAEHLGLITSVQVNLVNFSHTSPDDLDLMLVAPSGRKVILMSDVGGNNPVNNLSMTFDDTAPSLPDNAQLTSGNYRPTDFEPGDEFPFPATPDAPTGKLLSVLNGSEANGIWKLFLVDDNGNHAGNISGGWSLDVQTSLQAVAIPESGAAQPFPAEVTVSGLPGAISKMSVTLSNFSHLAPDDVDLLLVAPGGRRIVLMSDVGGQTEVGGVNITLDDSAISSLPDDGPLVSGTFKPTNFESGDSFPLPAPQGEPTGTTLNAFFGIAPNGVWKLYAVDDTGANFGSLAGSFSLDIESSLGVCQFTLSANAQAFPTTGGTGQFAVQMPTGCPWEAVSQSSFITIDSSSTGEGAGTISYTVAPNMGGGRTGRILVASGSLTRTFTVQQSSGCPFTVGQTALSFGAAGGNGNVQVTATGACGWMGKSDSAWIQVTSPEQSGNGSLTFTVLPNPAALPRSGNITVGPHQIAVTQTAATAATPFDFDGDAKADLSVFRNASGTWYVRASQTGALLARAFGTENDKLVPADYDGDGRTDHAVFRNANGVWYLLGSQNGNLSSAQFGMVGDIPAPGDYDGDGKADIAVFRPASGVFYLLHSSDGSFHERHWGTAGDVPVAGDYDGDGRIDLGVYRNATNTFYIRRSSDGTMLARQWGAGGNVPVAADFDGDGKTDIAVYAESGIWYYLQSSDEGFRAVGWGMGGDLPVAADYDGDAMADVAVFRPANAHFYIRQSTNGVLHAEQFGATGDLPLANAYVP